MNAAGDYRLEIGLILLEVLGISREQGRAKQSGS